jgi:fucose 4-O-acetylase-like acetyltransferase
MLLVACGFAVAAIGWPLVPSIEDREVMPYTRLTIVIGGAAIALALPLLARMNVPRAVRVVGQNSFAVFVLNGSFVHAIRVAIGPVASPLDSLARVAVIVAVSVGLGRALQRWVPWAMP